MMKQAVCKEPGKLVPKIDAGRCEGKADCEAQCPTGVFVIRKPDPAEWAALGWLAKVKVTVHGGKQGFVARPDACAACAVCVSACPEKAITLHKA
jgi:4Fe-4S ferredoxin